MTAYTLGQTITHDVFLYGAGYNLFDITGLGAILTSSDVTALTVLQGVTTIENQGTVRGGNGIELRIAGTVVNAAGGDITASGSADVGILFEQGGSLLNAGTIAAGSGMGILALSAVTVSNSGLISGGKTGIDLEAGASGSLIDNLARGTITGSNTAIYAADPATIENAGSVSGQYGIHLSGGGMITNAAGGVISGNSQGIESDAGVTIDNAGSIGASNFGIRLFAGGTITNEASGTISGGGTSYFSDPKYAIWINSRTGPTVIVNYGTIAAGRYSVGVCGDRYGVTTVFNRAGGVIEGGDMGVALNASSSIINAGTMIGSNWGVDAGYIRNEAGGTIEGGMRTLFIGQYTASGTIYNAGLILKEINYRSSDAETVSFGYGNDKMIIAPTSQIVQSDGEQGVVDGAGGTNTLELAAGDGGTGTLTQFGYDFINFQVLTIDSGADWVVDGSDTITSHITLIDAGTLRNEGSIGATVTLASGGMFDNAGTSGPIVGSAGGSVTNEAGHIIRGSSYGVRITNAPGQVDNAGTIDGYGAAGVALDGGGYMINRAGGVVVGAYGVRIGAGTLVNDGLVLGTQFGGGAAVLLSAGGMVSNASNAFIYSIYGTGLEFGAGGSTLDDAGRIKGGDGIAVQFSGSGNRLILETGASFDGVVTGGSGNVLELAAGSGVLGGFGTQFTDFSSIVVDTGTSWRFAAGQTIAANVTLGSNVSLANTADITGTVTLGANASFSNAGESGAVVAPSAAATVENAGTIAGTPRGIFLEQGGVVDNAAGGTISGTSDGIMITGAAGTVENAGSVGGGDFGVALMAGGTVDNAAGGTLTGQKAGVEINGGSIENAGTISGVVGQGTWTLTNEVGGVISDAAQTGVYASTGSAVIDNFGTIGDAGNYGVNLRGGAAALTNAAGGLIEGQKAGIRVSASATTIENAGTILGTGIVSSEAITLGTGATLSNETGGLIEGLTGVIAAGSDTIENAGTIDGTGGTAVTLRGGENRVIVDSGAVFGGKVTGTSTDTLELATGGTGTIAGFGISFNAFGTIAVDAGASWVIEGANTFAGGSTFDNDGTLVLDHATAAGIGTLINNGDIVLDPSLLSVGNLTGAGMVTLDAGSTLAVSGTIASGERIVFDGSDATVVLGTNAFTASIEGFGAGDTIDLAGLAFDGTGSANFNAGTGVLTVSEDGSSRTFTLSGDFTGEYFHLADDGAGGSALTEDGTPCYCRGTLILTDQGDVAVEDLRIGDLVVTKSGERRPIRWIGTRSYSGRFAMGNKDVLPILIRQHALGENVPKRDLWVSPLHAMYLEGVLIPAAFLVNGMSITQAKRVDKVEYFHIELDSHDVIVAEGALSESFVDDDNRGMFHNAAAFRAHYPDAVRAPVRYCAPRVEDGEPLQAARDRILGRLKQTSTKASYRAGALG